MPPHSTIPLEHSRVYWRGVTLLEEHEIAPTYEVYLGGCPLRCPYCAVMDASRNADRGARIAPGDLARDLLLRRHPPFRAVALVGGEPTLHLPWIRAFLPELRRLRPGVDAVINTALCWEAGLAVELASAFDWIVGTVRYHEPACATALGAPAAYPAQARAAVEALLASGARVLLRVLLLPGHLECCARPLARWIAGLQGDLRARVMINYAPVGAARAFPGLDRTLSEGELTLASTLLDPTVPRPRASPSTLVDTWPETVDDPPVSIEIDASGRVFAPFVTGSLLPWLSEHEPSLRPRLAYLDRHAH